MQRLRDVLLVILAVTTGAVDATSFERLGHVFGSVMTGNLVVLGISAGRADGRTALSAGCAMAGYAIGVMLAAPHGRKPPQDLLWPARASRALLLDLALLAAFTVGWELDGAHPSRAVALLLQVAVAGGMGVQSAAVRQIGPMSTTYLTSTLTGVLESLVVWRWPAEQLRSLCILLAALASAAATVVLLDNARGWVPALMLAPLLVSIVGSRRLSGTRVRGPQS